MTVGTTSSACIAAGDGHRLVAILAQFDCELPSMQSQNAGIPIGMKTVIFGNRERTGVTGCVVRPLGQAVVLITVPTASALAGATGVVV